MDQKEALEILEKYECIDSPVKLANALSKDYNVYGAFITLYINIKEEEDRKKAYHDSAASDLAKYKQEDHWDDFIEMCRDIKNYALTNHVKIYVNDEPKQLKYGFIAEDGKIWLCRTSSMKRNFNSNNDLGITPEMCWESGRVSLLKFFNNH